MEVGIGPCIDYRVTLNVPVTDAPAPLAKIAYNGVTKTYFADVAGILRRTDGLLGQGLNARKTVAHVTNRIGSEAETVAVESQFIGRSQIYQPEVCRERE